MLYLILLAVGLGLGFFGHNLIVTKLTALKDKIAAKL